MTDLALHYRHRLLAAIAALPRDPPPAAIDEACMALRNTLATGSPYQLFDGREVGVVFEHLEL